MKYLMSRRTFVKTSLAGIAIGGLYFVTRDVVRTGLIGAGHRGRFLAGEVLKSYLQRRGGTIVAACDVDQRSLARCWRNCMTADIYKDYRHVLDRKDIEAVIIATPDHWHAKIAIEAMCAGKDVYCEKPISLTIEEGKKICQTVEKTGQVFQAGTQQRSQFDHRFLKAIALLREGRIGRLKSVNVSIGGGSTGGPFPVNDVPKELEWNMWLGQAPEVPFANERLLFRNWREYSGGRITDWGAHHIDIAQWAIGMENSGPNFITGTGKIPTLNNGYNNATQYDLTFRFANNLEMNFSSTGREGILFEGEDGRFFVNRGVLSGEPVERLKDNPLPADAIAKLYEGEVPTNHIQHFFDCVRTRKQPISDVFTQHRASSTCHLANICLQLGRELQWDPVKEEFVDDQEANAMLSRDPRPGFEISV